MKASGKKKIIKNSVGRVFFVAVAVLLQIFWLVFIISQTGKYYPYIAAGTQIAAMIIVIAIYSQRKSSASKMLWITLALASPVFGLVLYALVGQPWASKIVRRKFNSKIGQNNRSSQTESENTCKPPEDAGNIIPQMRYLSEWCGFPTYNDTKVIYHSDTDAAYKDLISALNSAEKFIFMEYHAIQSGQSFAAIESILIKKAASGIDVKILYDDVGSAAFIGKDFKARMEANGIQCRVFNPLVPFVLAFMNNRDHRKLTIIDGRIGFTGGYNLADEYFNINSPYGYWKDAGVMIEGPAVGSLTSIFIELWNFVSGKSVTKNSYTHKWENIPSHSESYVIPYADSPLDDERVGENVYLNALKSAKQRAWFTTPYLILDDEMISELTLAAKRGIDVRIITPGIPDKKIVFQLTRSYYDQLIRNGVRIYEYSPGFLHAKQLLTDDDLAIIGTVNLDYRSLYLHFENGILLYRCECIRDIHQNFDAMFKDSCEITYKDISNKKISTRILQNILRLFAPLL